MKRKLIHKLLEWKELGGKNPLLLTGGKGVGKTNLCLEFAKTFYSSYIYMNYELNINSLEQSDTKKITTNYILNYMKQVDSPEPVLFILDEVSFFDDFYNLVDELKGNGNIHMIVISSIHVFQKVAEYDKLTLYPLDFEEFLLAVNKEWYIGVIIEHFGTNLPIPDIVHSELLYLLDIYLQVGGMPLAVNEYVCSGVLFNIAQMHKLILNGYLSERCSDYMEVGNIRVGQILKILPLQLGKANKKFQYSLIRKGVTKKLYTDALEYVKHTFYAMDCHRIEESDEDYQQFKLYLFDTGILNSLSIECKLDNQKEFKKGLIENYVAMHLFMKGYPLRFWESESKAKIEFVMEYNTDWIPIEVRSDHNTRSKSLSMFRSKYCNTGEGIKISTRNFTYENHIKYVPLYAVFCIG